jgi:membrane-associated phospholipid phosphatase
MNFDIEYLLLLQQLRAMTGGIFDEFFNALSKFAVTIMPILPYVVYWCADKKWGYRFISTLWFGEIITGATKLTVCAYRPWIRSDLIEPAGDSKVAATGYSFPSGHTVAATSTYGSTIVWQKDKRRWLAILLSVVLALTAFSRNFLGVHTPQDVLVGFVIPAVVIFILGKCYDKFENKQKTLDYLTLLGIFIDVMVLVYITFKPYPMEYVDGKLLVDPQVMMNDCFKACGGFLGLMVGNYIERHYVHYEIPVTSRNLPIMSCIGAGIVLSWKEYLGSAIFVEALGGHWGNFIARFLMMFFAVAVYPVFIKKFCGIGEDVAAGRNQKV